MGKIVVLIIVYIISGFISVIITEALGIENTNVVVTGTIILTFCILFLMKRINLKEIFGKWNIEKESFFWGLNYFIANLFALFILQKIFPFFETKNHLVNKPTIISMILLSLIIPIVEEVFFRGIICNLLIKKYSPIMSIIISGVIFAFGHGSAGLIFLLTGSSFYFGYIYIKSNSLWNSIIVHIINNSIVSLISYYLSGNESTNDNSLGVIYYIIGIVSLLLCFYNLYRMYKNFNFKKIIKKDKSKNYI